MSASLKILHIFTISFSFLKPNSLRLLSPSPSPLPAAHSFRFNSSGSPSSYSSMQNKQQGRGGHRGGHRGAQTWKEKETPNSQPPVSAVANRLSGLNIAETNGQTAHTPAPPVSVPVSVPGIQFGSVPVVNQVPAKNSSPKAVWKPKSYGTMSGTTNVATNVEDVHAGSPNVVVNNKGSGSKVAAAGKSNAELSKLFQGPIGADFSVDNYTYSLAQVRATFYPKFENEKSDQEVRTRMIEMVSRGLATLEPENNGGAKSETQTRIENESRGVSAQLKVKVLIDLLPKLAPVNLDATLLAILEEGEVDTSDFKPT